MIVRVTVPPGVLAYAASEAKRLGKLRNSITNGDGNVAGFIGDAIVADYIGGTVSHTYDYDVLLGKQRIDVKTKRTTVAPREDYECSVADFNTTQDCDLYAFVRVLDSDLSTAWLLGCIPKEFFYRNARFLKAGQVDGSNSFVVKADCYNVFIRDLLPLPEKAP